MVSNFAGPFLLNRTSAPLPPYTHTFLPNRNSIIAFSQEFPSSNLLARTLKHSNRVHLVVTEFSGAFDPSRQVHWELKRTPSRHHIIPLLQSFYWIHEVVLIEKVIGVDKYIKGILKMIKCLFHKRWTLWIKSVQKTACLMTIICLTNCSFMNFIS